MKFTPRMKLILHTLLIQDETMSVQNLAERAGVSKRTIQRELEFMNASLKGYEVRFFSKTGVGVWLEGSRAEKERLLSDITKDENYDAGNKEERRKRLVLEILKDKGLKKLFYYASKFKVSETTVSADLEAVEDWLNGQGLSVIRKPGSGVEIEGSEENYRRAIRTFINENIDAKVLREAYESDEDTKERCSGLFQSNIGHILNNDILKRVVNCIMGMEEARVMSLTEHSYTGLVLHITIAINRILQKEIIEADTGWSEKLPQDEDYQLARRIADELSEEFEIEIPPLEVSYICLHLKGAKHEKASWADKKTLAAENRQLQQLVNEMVDTFDAKNAFLLKQDEEFIQGLLAHLQPTFIRLAHDMRITNPVLEEIKQSYPDIFARCRKVAELLTQAVGKPVPEAEIGFLTVHFGAAVVRLEGKKEIIRPVKMGVVCSSGIGISRLMSSKLEKTFRDRVVITTYGKKDITPYIIGKNDFFVSSISMDDIDAPIVYVNPLLNEADMEAVRKLVYQYERTPEKEKEKTAFSVQLEEINLAAAQINTVIKYMEFAKVNPAISFEALLGLIGEQLTPYTDFAELIKADIREREKIGSQIFAEFGFALLHTRTAGINRPVFMVCIPENLNCFTDPYFKQIQAVFIMLIPKDGNIKINSEILGHISTVLIEDYVFMDTVLKGDKEKIRDALSVHLKKFFSKYIAKIS